jgi:hypothetical protein
MPQPPGSKLFDAFGLPRRQPMLGGTCEPGMIKPERMTDEKARIERRRIEPGGAKVPRQVAPHLGDRGHDQ